MQYSEQKPGLTEYPLWSLSHAVSQTCEIGIKGGGGQGSSTDITVDITSVVR